MCGQTVKHELFIFV